MKHTINLSCEVQLILSADSSARRYGVTFTTSEGDIVGHAVRGSIGKAANEALSDALAELLLLGVGEP